MSYDQMVLQFNGMQKSYDLLVVLRNIYKSWGVWWHYMRLPLRKESASVKAWLHKFVFYHTWWLLDEPFGIKLLIRQRTNQHAAK